MKSNQPNTIGNPSVSNPRDNPCLERDASIAALKVIADEGISHPLPYAQFLYAENFQSGFGTGA